MKKLMFPVLGLGLLLASCGNGNTDIATSPTTTSNTEIPEVPRVVNTGNFVCPAGNGAMPNGQLPLSVRLNKGVDIYDQGTHAPSQLRAQSDLPQTLQDLLYSTKSIINTMYYGYSTVDLDALHNSAYKDFKKDFPNALNSYIISDYWFTYSNVNEDKQDAIDKKMNTYIDGVEDEHTFYMNRAQTEAEKNGSAPTPVLGVTLALVPNEDGLILTSVRLDGPAWTAGLRRGDVIMSINGTPLARTAGLDNDKQYAAMRKVLSAAIAAGGDLVMDIKTAGKIHSVRATPAVLTGTNMPWGEVRTDSAGKKHFYLYIPTFQSVRPQRTDAIPTPIANKVHQLVAQAQTAGVDNMVIDLRENGGGLLHEFVGVAGAFAPGQAGESTRYVDGSSINYGYSNGKVNLTDGCNLGGISFPVINPAQWKGKLVVLVDSNSASASEMLSTNLRNAGVKIIGTETVGVGNTSTYHLDLPGSRSMSITAGRTLINGQPLDKSVIPDIHSEDDYAKLADTGVDNTLQAAYNYLNQLN